MRRLRFLLATLIAAATLAVVAAPASAYLHVATAQSHCQSDLTPYFDAWADNTYGSGYVFVTTSGSWYHRVSSNAVIVDCAFMHSRQVGGAFHSQGEVRAYMVEDYSPGAGGASPYFGGGYPSWMYLGPLRCSYGWCFPAGF